MAETREAHLAWCKERALEYVAIGQLEHAVASMVSDLRKHEETAASAAAPVAMLGFDAINRGPGEVRRWIEGFA